MPDSSKVLSPPPQAATVTAIAAAASAVVEVRTARNPTAQPVGPRRLSHQFAELGGGEQLSDLGRGGGPSEMEALGVIAAQLAQRHGVLRGLDTLADRLDL